MYFFKSIFLTFTLWVLTALLNGLLGGCWLYFSSNPVNGWPTAFMMAFICTLFFFIPGMFVLWIVLLVHWKKALLFRLLLKTGMIVSLLSTLLLFKLNAVEINKIHGIKEQQLFLSICMLIAATGAIMLHHSIIQSISSNKKTHHHV